VQEGIVTVSKTAVSFRSTHSPYGYAAAAGPNFTGSPDKILLLANEQTLPPNVHLKMATMNKKGTKEIKHDFHFANRAAAVVDTTGRAGYIYTRGVACDECDNSLNVLFALLSKVR
jgi:hypothetical protein